MPSDYARRGRPRGSGLDDRGQLRRIIELLEADPALKPTTAIKSLGVSDPSTIRRLRDKLKEAQSVRSIADTGAAGDVRPHEIHAGRSSSSPAARHTGTCSAMPAPAAALAETSSSRASNAPLSLFMQWCVLGLSAVSSTVEAQMAVMEDLLSAPQVASALRHQLLVNEVAKSFCPTRSDVRTTLH